MKNSEKMDSEALKGRAFSRAELDDQICGL
jgi:hypothetical protein